MKIDLSNTITESHNPASDNIDMMSTIDIVTLINHEDKTVAFAVEKALGQIAQAVDDISYTFINGGRLIYCGASSSGRIGVLDASECSSNYGAPNDRVIGLISGGVAALTQDLQHVEDNPQLGKQDLIDIEFNANDILVGITASGTTPYVLGAMQYARTCHAKVIALTCNPKTPASDIATLAIVTVVGPEVIAGSSRMKAGTAQKLVLNMLSTGAMIRMGRVYRNLMVDIDPRSAKHRQRQINIITQITGCDSEQAHQALHNCANHCKTAIVSILTGLDATAARALLDKNDGFIRAAIAS